MVKALMLRIVAVLAAAVTLMAGPATAQLGGAQQVLPPIDLFVFLDNSKTIFTGGADAPNQRLADMLETAFALPIDGTRTLVNQDGRVSLYTFGEQVVPLVQNVDGANMAALTNALSRFRVSAVPDRKTDFKPLLQFIANLPSLKEGREKRLKIVLIASDFIHDPSDQAENNRGTGVCDLLKLYKSTQKIAVAPDIDAIRKATAVPDDGSPLPVYTGLFVVRPSDTDFAGTSKGYRDCALETVRLRPLVQSLEKELGAQTVDYADATKDLNQFARDFVDSVLRATRPRLAVTNGTCIPRGLEGVACSLTVQNPARIASRLRSVTFYDQPDGPALATVAADRAVNPGETDIVEVRLTGTEARSLLAADTIHASLDSEGRGFSVRVRLDKQGRSGLALTAAKAERKAAGQPASLTVTLSNPQSAPRTPQSLGFFTANRAGTDLGRISLPSAGTELAAGTNREFTIPLTAAIDAALDRSPVFVSVQSMDRENIGDPESPRVSVAYGRALPFQIDSVKATVENGQLFLTIDVQSPGQPARPVRNILFYGTDNTPFTTEAVTADNARMVPAGGQGTIRLRLDQTKASLLGNGLLRVAVDDASSGLVSAPANVGYPVTAATSLGIDARRWIEKTNSGLLEARITIRNGDPILRETLTAFVLSGEAQENTSVPVEPTVTLKPGETTEVPVIFDVNDLTIRSIFRQKTFTLQAKDNNGNIGQATRFDSPDYSPLKLRGGEFAANDKGLLELKLTIENPMFVLNRLVGVKIYGKGGHPEVAEPLPLPTSEAINGLDARTIGIPINRDLFRAHSPHLDQNVILIDELGQEQPGRTRRQSFPIQPLPAKPLKIGNGAVWSDRLPLALTIPVQNEAVYNQTLGRVLLAPTEGGDAESYTLPTGQEIPGAGTQGPKNTPAELRVPVVIQDDWHGKLLTGQTVWVCALTDMEVVLNQKSCPGGWSPVAVPPPKPLAVQASKNHPFNPYRREVRIDVENSGLTPNQVTGYALQTADGKKDLLQRTLDKPEIVDGGKTITHTIRLTESETRALAEAQRFQIILRDKTSGSNQGVSNPYFIGIPVFDFNFSELKSVKVPTKESYTAISVNIEIENKPRINLGEQKFAVHLINEDGVSIGDPITISHKFSNAKASETFPVAWGVAGDFLPYSNSIVKIESESNKENNKSIKIPPDINLDLAIIMAASALLAFIIIIISISALIVKRMANSHVAFLSIFGSKLPSIFEWLISQGSVLGVFSIIPSVMAGVLWFFDCLDLAKWAAVVTIITTTFAIAFLGTSFWKKIHINRKASKGDDSREMPIIIHKFEYRAMLVAVLIFAIAAMVLVRNAIVYAPVDPRTFEHHWDYREHLTQVAAAN